MDAVSWPPYPRRSLTRMPTRPYWSERRDSTADTAPLDGSIDADDTNTGRSPSEGNVRRCTPEKFASRAPGCDRSYEPRPPSLNSQFRMLVDQSSEARQLCGTS